MKPAGPGLADPLQPTGTPDDDHPQAAVPRRSQRTSIETLVVATFVLFGLRTGFQQIHDNSALLHLRTGINMVASGHIPHSDPYSFTALHHSWVVESWFAELLMGLAYRIGGLHLVVIEEGLIMAAVAFVIATLARTGHPIRTMAAAGIAELAGWTFWAQRPLMFGLLGLALLLLVVERRKSPWWLLPIGWVWVNTHGSFPLGLLWLVTVYVGMALEERRRPRELEPYVVAFVGSLLVGAINPFGPTLLTFPIVVESHHAVFARIVEWRSPDFQLFGSLVSLVFFALALLVIARRGAPWRDVLVVVGFLALGLVSERNLAPAAIVLAPVLGRALRPAMSSTNVAATGDAGTSGEGGASRAQRSGAPPIFGIVLGVVALLFVVGVYGVNGLLFRYYPTGAEHYLATHGLLDGRRIVTQDYVGDYRELVEGAQPTSKVFIDDRADMYPVAVENDYATLQGGRVNAVAVLDRWNIQVVMWQKGGGLPDELQAIGGWRTVYTDRGWLVLVRDPTVPPHIPR